MPTRIKEKDASVEFRLQPWRMYTLIGLGLLLVSQGPLILAAALSRDEGVTLGTIVVTMIALAIAGAGVWGIVFAVRRLRGGDVAIAVGPSGLYDSILFPDPLPWPEMRRPSLRYSGISGWRLMFDVDVQAEERLGVGPGQRRIAAWWRSVGARAYRVYLFGTDSNMTRLRAALERYVTVERPSGFSRILGRE